LFPLKAQYEIKFRIFNRAAKVIFVTAIRPVKAAKGLGYYVGISYQDKHSVPSEELMLRKDILDATENDCCSHDCG